VSLTSDPSKIPYEFRPDFEAGMLRLSALYEDFWEKAGRHLDPELLGTEPGRLIGKALREITKESGHPEKTGSQGVVRVVQRIQRWSTEDGRIPRDKVNACYEFLMSAPQLGIDDTVRDVVPQIRRQLDMKLSSLSTGVLLAEDRDKARSDVQKALSVIESVGKRQTPKLYNSLSVADFRPALRLARLRRIPFGIPELDGIVGGGPQLGQLGFVAAYSGVGKSMFLNHWMCAAARANEFCIYLTGEMLQGLQSFRSLANFTSIETKAIANSEEWENEAAVRYQWLIEKKQICPPIIHPFRQTVTKIQDLFAIVEEYEKREGRRASLILLDADEHVDYENVDFPGLEKLAKKNPPGTYEGYGRLYAYLSWQAKGGQDDPSDRPDLTRVIGAASQVKGEPNPARFKILTGEEAADSKRKIRIVDWAVTVNYKHAEQGNVYYVAKGRHDAGWGSTPPLARNVGMGQIVAVKDPYPWIVDPQRWKRKQREFW